jgi:Tannase and feruloyl esterase
MKTIACLLTALVCLLAVGADPAAAKNSNPLPTCSALAGVVVKEAGKRLNKTPIAPAGFTISSATPVTATVIPASAPHLTYCQVVFQLNPAITIQVGLPLNPTDGGVGGDAGGCGLTSVTNNSCIAGNWNGRIEAVGNGGYSGSVPAVTGATDVGFVGSSTDNGHSPNWCNAIDPETGEPNAQPNCGVAGGGFELTPDNQLLPDLITDFIDTSEVEQTTWAELLTDAYYGRTASRTYWNGCSTGGRQGMQMAQFHPELFDGILAGAPAFNWNRFIIGEMWPPVVVADVDAVDCPGGTAEGCSTGIPAGSAFANAYTAANAAAVAACDANDGVVDGVIGEPRSCFYSASALIGQQPAPMTSPMTKAEAQAIDLIWDGPRNQRGQRLWGGITRGTSFATLTASPFTGSLITTYVYNWLQQNPDFDILGNITTANFSTYFQLSDRKFADTEPPPPGFVVPAATDSIDLEELIRQGTKLIHYRGSADPLIVPFGSWNYDTRLFQKYGVAGTKDFYRSFFYPGNGHCGGNAGFSNAGLINSTDLFNALIDWVENGTAPDSVVAFTEPNDTGNSTLICPNPNHAVYNGSGPTTSASSYHCTNLNQEPPDLAGFDQTAVQYHEAP